MPAAGETIDWLVRMRRLPEDQRLDRCIAQRRVDAPRIEALAAVLGRFHRAAPPLPVSPAEHLELFGQEQRINREVLLDPHWRLAGAAAVLDGFDAVLAQQASALAGVPPKGRSSKGTATCALSMSSCSIRRS